MKVIIVALAFVAVAAAATIVSEPATIVFSNNKQIPDGGYSFGFESSDGSSRQEQGELKTVQNEENKPKDVIVIRGDYSYTDPEGNFQTFKYYADETGFHVEGPSVPKTASRR